MTDSSVERYTMPVLPLRDVVVYPHMVIPLFVGREKSIRCLDAAMEQDKQIFLVAQKDASVDEPKSKDIYEIGSVATILQMLKLPDGTVKVLVEGIQRAKIQTWREGGRILYRRHRDITLSAPSGERRGSVKPFSNESV